VSTEPNGIEELWDAALQLLHATLRVGLPGNTRRARIATILEQIAATLRSNTRRGVPARPQRRNAREPMARIAMDWQRQGSPLKIAMDRAVWREAGQPAAVQIEVDEGGSVRLRPVERATGVVVNATARMPFVLVADPALVPVGEGWRLATVIEGVIELDTQLAENEVDGP